MSAALILLALAQAAAPSKTPAAKPAVASAGRKLPAPSPAARSREAALKTKMEAWRGNWRIGPEGVSCKTETSTGDKRLDTIGCRAIQFCYAAKLPAVSAIESGDAAADVKKAKVADLLNGAKSCVATNRAMAIEVIAGTRLAPRLAGGRPEPHAPSGR